MLAEAPPWLASASGRGGRPPDLAGAVESGDRLGSEPAAGPAGHSGYRPASFFSPPPARQMAPPPTVASPARKKSGWKGWNSFFRRRKVNSDSSSDEAAAAVAAARRRETACVSSPPPPPRSPVSCYQRQRPAGSTESLDGLRGLSSGGSEVTAGGARRNRRSAVKARVEARRSNTASSEDEEPPLQRVPSQLSLPRDGSLSRRSRAARTERYNRRRSRDDLSLQQEMMLERRRDEERRGPVPQRWAATVTCRQTENGASPGPRDPLYPGQSTAGPKLQPSYFAPAPRRAVPVTNGANPQLVTPSSPSSLHPCDERYPLPLPAAVPTLRSSLAASASVRQSESGRAPRPPPPPPPPRDPRIKITLFPEPSPVSHSLDQLKAPTRCHTVTVRDIPPPSGGTSSRSVPAQVSALRPRVKLSQCQLSGSDQSIAQYKQQLYDRHRSPGAGHVYSYTDTALNCTTGQPRSSTDRAPASSRSRYASQDSAFLSDSQPPAAPPVSASTQMPSANGAPESWQRTAGEQQKIATERVPPPSLPTIKSRCSPARDSLASSLSEMSAPISQNTSFSCHDSDSVLGRSRGERRPRSLVAERRPEPAGPPPPPRPASEQAQRRSENFEEALDELEAIYKSLRLDDEDLLDRAERRDLPTPHQELWRAPSTGQRPETSEEPDELDLNCTLSSEELSGGRWQSTSSLGSESRHRAPALRRSAVPNKQEDDVYTRRLKHNEKTPNSNLLCDVLSQGGSYLLVSPVLSPTASMDNVRSEPPVTGDRQPDLTLDDVTFRNNRHANAVKIIEPQPPFGIPLGPTCPAAASDYLHVTPPQGKTRATFRPRKNPDLVADDLAFRALRKDKTLIDTNALDALIRETDQIGKKRATRTLSDDLSLMVKAEAKQPSGRPVSLCVCGGHSISDCELDRELVAARRLRPVRLRPRPESQRTYGLYNLYVGNLSEPETGGSRTSRSRTASITTSTETLTEMGQRPASGQFATQVRPFLRVCSESEADSLPSVSRSRASTAPPSPVRADSDTQLESLLESLQLEEAAAGGRHHRPPRLTATLHALSDIDKAKIPPSAMAAPHSVADFRPPSAETTPSVTEHKNTPPDTGKASNESPPTSEPLSTTSSVPLPSVKRSESPPLSAGVRPPAAGQEAPPHPRPPRPQPPSPEAADAAEAVRKGELTSDLWLAGSLLVCMLQLLGVSALPAALAVLAVLLVAAALIL